MNDEQKSTLKKKLEEYWSLTHQSRFEERAERKWYEKHWVWFGIVLAIIFGAWKDMLESLTSWMLFFSVSIAASWATYRLFIWLYDWVIALYFVWNEVLQKDKLSK